MRQRVGIGAVFGVALLACGTSSSDSAPSDDVGTDSGGVPSSEGGVQPPVEVTDTVAVAGGKIKGAINGSLAIFKGIPFAAPPTGALRWKAPTPAAAWEGTKEASEFGAVCMQQNGTGSEDCLTVNVWAHAGTNAPRHVMVWIHGGGFIDGSGSLAQYEASKLATDTDAVVVTINYRLGAFGFLASDALVAESPNKVAGNYGILDQVFALQWVKDNIAKFGGDPGRVMIFGESAGGASVCALLAAPLAQGMFQAAAVESGPCGIFPSLATTSKAGAESSLDTGATFLAASDCAASADALACLRALPAAKVNAAQAKVPTQDTFVLPLSRFMPTVDGVVFPKLPIEALANGATGDVSTIVGANKDEAVTFLATFPDNESLIVGGLEAKYGKDNGDAIYALYADEGGAKSRLVQFAGDLVFNCPAEALAKTAAGGKGRTYLYTMTRGWDDGYFPGMGTFHGMDFLYLFSSFSTFKHTPSPEDLTLALAMKSAWSGLVSGAMPAQRFQVDWPAYDSATHTSLNIDLTSSTTSVYRKGRCDALRAKGIVP